MTTDKLAAHKNALNKYMKDIPYVYLQIVKRRIKRRLITVKKVFVKGAPVDFPSQSQNTSFIERLNLTLRLHVSYLQRKTLGYCKCKANFSIFMWLNLFNYNYVQLHKSLRIKINYTKDFGTRFIRIGNQREYTVGKHLPVCRCLVSLPI